MPFVKEVIRIFLLLLFSAFIGCALFLLLLLLVLIVAHALVYFICSLNLAF